MNLRDTYGAEAEQKLSWRRIGPDHVARACECIMPYVIPSMQCLSIVNGQIEKSHFACRLILQGCTDMNE